MQPITLQHEPVNFDHDVRQPGLVFLRKNPSPKANEWTGKEYWQRALADMRNSYNKLCAYSACWIPHSTGNHSVDHFIPKSISPIQAYEWTNFRYVSARFNGRKGITTIVDPFSMSFPWFIIDFSNFFVLPDINVLKQVQVDLANETIRILKLNIDDELVKERQEFYNEYKSGNISFNYVQRKFPFLAYEMNRQNKL